MAKTFDNISEASATNYLFLFAQRTLALQSEAPTPPPLNVVGLPCAVICLLWACLHPKMRLLWDWLHPKKVRAEKAPEIEEAAPKKKALQERSAVNSEEAAKKIAPLAKQITEYILDHQDDAAQEDRWRTTMKRDTAKSFREQREAITEQREASKKSFHTQREESNKAIDRLDSRFDMQREAIEEVRQLVNDVCKNLATLANAKQD